MVCNGTNDIMVGKNASIKTIGVLYGYSSQKQLKELEPNFIAKTPKEIVQIINNLYC